MDGGSYCEAPPRPTHLLTAVVIVNCETNIELSSHLSSPCVDVREHLVIQATGITNVSSI